MGKLQGLGADVERCAAGPGADGQAACDEAPAG